MSTRLIQARTVPLRTVEHLTAGGIHPLLARLYAARGIAHPSEVDYTLSGLIPPQALTGADEAASLLADAIEAGARMVIIADYDCDGATACAVGMRALRAFGADVHYLVPDCATMGYGLTPEMVALAARLEPELIITVDNGIASLDGVAAARALGIATLITDHHLPAEVLPEADAIVNPNQPGCEFPSKALAGVGVMFYVMLALRAELRERGAFQGKTEPNLGNLLDLVALGTVADVVQLDRNNRILVAQGLQRMRSGRMQPGIRALFAVAGRDHERATSTDLGFLIGPRLNAAGRLSDMRLGIECLITDDAGRALNIAQQLDQINRERRQVEAEMQHDALASLQDFDTELAASVSLYQPDWHQGVIGLVAGKLKERLHRPTFAFAPGNVEGELKGSGRSIPGVHLRDALDLVSKREPDLLLRFGGHAMAAGVSLREADFPRFSRVFDEVVQSLVDDSILARRTDTDGALEPGWMSLEGARLLEREIWGQGFPAPLFDDVFEVEQQRLLKDKHLKLRLRKGGTVFDGIRFNHADGVPSHDIHAVFKLGVNEYNGVSSVQLLLEHFDAA